MSKAPARQAAGVMKKLQGVHLKSVGTVRNYEGALTQACGWIQQQGVPDFRAMSLALAVRYLEERGEQVGQKTLDMDRQALQLMMQHVTRQLAPGQRLPVIKSDLARVLSGRAYTAAQVAAIASHQTGQHALATEIAYAAGLRAHELLTLRLASERPADSRPQRGTKFQGREGERYTVVGKGGLCREVLLPRSLAERLEGQRLAASERVTDRGVFYFTRYDLAGGQRWSASFGAASARVLGWSTGAHGVRHSYAQERMRELQFGHLVEYRAALETVSQEMGHFRGDITEVYLR